MTVTWYQHTVAYAEMKWPHLAAHSRASMADALATVTPLLTRETGRRPQARALRAALYGHAFNPQQRLRAPDPATASALAWLERASLPVGQLSDPRIIRAALDGLCVRLDGSPAAANTITRKRAVLHGTLGYAVELGLRAANPADRVQWRAPTAAVAVNPSTVASPAQVRAILAQVVCVRPDLVAFFGCLYYAALRPEEAVALRRDDLILPAHGRGKMILTAACPAQRLSALHRWPGREDIVSQRIEDALDADARIASSSQYAKASGLADRRSRLRPCSLFVRERVPRPRIAHGCQPRQTHTATCRCPLSPTFAQLKAHLDYSRPKPTDGRILPTHSPRDTADGLMNRSLCTQKPVTQFRVTGSELGKRVAGGGFEPPKAKPTILQYAPACPST